MYLSLYLLDKIFHTIKKNKVLSICENLTRNGFETFPNKSISSNIKYLVVGKIINIILNNNKYYLYKIHIGKKTVYIESKNSQIYLFNNITVKYFLKSYFILVNNNTLYYIKGKIFNFSDLAIKVKNSYSNIIRIIKQKIYIGFSFKNIFNIPFEIVLDVAIPVNRTQTISYYNFICEILLTLISSNKYIYKYIINIDKIIKTLFHYIFKINKQSFLFKPNNIFANLFENSDFINISSYYQHIYFLLYQYLENKISSIVKWFLFLNGYNFKNRVSDNLIFIMIFFGFYMYKNDIFSTYKSNDFCILFPLINKNILTIIKKSRLQREKNSLKIICQFKNIRYNVNKILYIFNINISKYIYKTYLFFIKNIFNIARIYYNITVEIYNKHRKILCNLKKINSIICVSKTLYINSLYNILDILHINIGYVNNKSLNFIVYTSISRIDIINEQSFSQEIVKIIEFQNIQSIIKIQKYIHKYNITLYSLEHYVVKIHSYLLSLNYSEVINFSFGSKNQYKRFSYTHEKLSTRWFKILNPLTKKLMYMRKSLVPDLVNTVIINIRSNIYRQNVIALFEIGRVFRKKNILGVYPNPKYLNTYNYCSDSPFIEELFCSGILMEPKYTSNIDLHDITESLFFSVKNMLLGLFQQINFSFINWKVLFFNNHNVIFMNYEKQSNIFLKHIFGKKIFIGFLGEHVLFLPKIYRVIIFEINISKILFIFSNPEIFKIHKPNVYTLKYPFIKRMLSIIIKDNISSYHILHSVSKIYCCNNILKNVIIIDVYRNKDTLINKKSLLILFIFQSKYKTLTDIEINLVINNIIKYINKRFIGIVKFY